ncbi:hypothetical protein SCUCBS95973_007463 [Sporothrix curviconia]|uniref:Uncharacterized protein n=1 Tax=Sporothrix curviconia TaxID=1260050 RepID=A0ABP0CG92_9PEZI
MPSFFCLLVLLAASSTSVAQPDQPLESLPSSPSPPPPPPPPHNPRQDPLAATITSVLTSVSVSVSVLTSTETSTSTSISTSTTTATTSDATRVVPVFYLDERAFEGLPYTVLHHVCGSVASVDADGGATTYVITTTRVDLVAKPTASLPENSSSSDSSAPSSSSSPGTEITTAPDTTTSSRRTPTASIITALSSWTNNATGPPSTITQGPSTFVFTGTRSGDPSRTVVNQCRLSGTTSARCNLTHVGPIWYTADANWNGTYSTYNYTWTSGDRYGFAPCTVTAGVSLLGPPTALLAAPTSTNGAAAAAAGRGAARGRRREGRADGGPAEALSLISLLLSPQLRNVVWPLLAMLGFLAGLFTLA